MRKSPKPSSPQQPMLDMTVTSTSGALLGADTGADGTPAMFTSESGVTYPDTPGWRQAAGLLDAGRWGR